MINPSAIVFLFLLAVCQVPSPLGARGDVNNAIKDTRQNIDVYRKLEEKKVAPTTPPEERAAIENTQRQLGRKTDQYAREFRESSTMQKTAADFSMASGDLGKARAYADRAVGAAKTDSEWIAGMNARAKVAEKGGDYPQAAAEALQVLKRFPGERDAMAIYQFAKGRSRGGSTGGSTLSPGPTAAERGAAARPPRSLPMSDPRESAAIARLTEARSRLAMNDPARALELARRIQTADASVAAGSLAVQAEALALLKNLDEAVARLTEAIGLLAKTGRRADLAALHARRAGYRNEQGRYAEALDDAGRALENDARSAEGYHERSRAAEGLGLSEEAFSAAERAAELDPAFMSELAGLRRRLRAGQADEPARRRAAVGARAAWGLGLLALLALLAAWARKAARSGEPRGLDGRYEVVKKIGEGGMGAVFEGRDAALGRPVAIKRLRAELQDNPRERERFVNEARLVAALRHPHIVEIHTILQDDEHTHIVFEYISGRTLGELLDASPDRRLEPRRAIELLRQIAEAVDYAHSRGIIHRDLKPANVMIDDVGGREWAKVMDFGIARQVEDALSGAGTGTIVGTPVYMSPEQARGEAGKRSDVYSLGVTFHEMLSGGPPPKAELPPGLPPAMAAAIAKALAPRAQDRHGGCLEFYEAAKAALG